MHWTIERTFQLFLTHYNHDFFIHDVLEVGSANINGGLRKYKSVEMDWLGVDIEPNFGVDLVLSIGEQLPFPNSKFSLVVSTSTFEHDIEFWSTFSEMSRVLNEDGLIILIIPSNGMFHQYPYDAFRFYPDSGTSMAIWANKQGHKIKLVESFTTAPENDIWADYVAIFSKNPDKHKNLIGGILQGENWKVGNDYVESSKQYLTYEMRKIQQLEKEIDHLKINLENQRKTRSSLIRFLTQLKYSSEE